MYCIQRMTFLLFASSDLNYASMFPEELSSANRNLIHCGYYLPFLRKSNLRMILLKFVNGDVLQEILRPLNFSDAGAITLILRLIFLIAFIKPVLSNFYQRNLYLQEVSIFYSSVIKKKKAKIMILSNRRSASSGDAAVTYNFGAAIHFKSELI